LAIAAGYGHSIDLQPLERGSRKAALYVSKYVTKSADARDDVPWWGSFVDESTGEVLEGLTDPTFRTWSQSRKWGTSMAAIRQVERQKFLDHRARVAAELDAFLASQQGNSESPPAPS
jgi:hypothetical protein